MSDLYMEEDDMMINMNTNQQNQNRFANNSNINY